MSAHKTLSKVRRSPLAKREIEKPNRGEELKLSNKKPSRKVLWKLMTTSTSSLIKEY
jgi:hypothetical protein